MKKTPPREDPRVPLRSSAVRATASGGGLLDEDEIDEIERASPNGLTSRQIVDVFETRGIRFSEATLRKYVQLGLLPRSVRVGRKGKHRGSCGLYPTHVVRRVNAVKGMMAEDRTIEEIQRSFARSKDDIDGVEKDLRALISGFEREAKAPAVDPEGRRELEREITEAKRAAGELVRRIAGLERLISARAAESSVAGDAVGGGSDLY
jgi:DNA-binding transcriptional MerR regulator